MKRIGTMMLMLFGAMFSVLCVEASSMKFSVSPIQNEHQKNKQVSYFDLVMSPSEKTTLKVKVHNDDAKPITVEAIVSSAKTNDNGVVEYQQNKIKADPTLKNNIESYLKCKSEMIIPGNTTVEYPLTLTMPKKAYEGYIAGGITLREKEAKEEKPKSKEGSGASVINKMQYAIAVLLRNSEKKGSPDLKLLKAYADQVNYRNAIRMTLQNPTTRYVNQLKMHYVIQKQNDSSVKYEGDTNDMQMAPNTRFNYPVNLAGIELKAGEYDVSLTAVAQKDDAGKYTFGKENYRYQWKFKTKFSISGELANTLNKKDVEIEHKPPIWPWIVGGILFLALFGFIFFLLGKRRRKDEEEKE